MVSDTPCRVTGNHDWVYGCQSMWCAKCWLVKVYPPPSLKPYQPPSTEVRKVGKPGRPHKRAWREAETQPECCYCEETFTEQNPPTLDHIIPISQGGSLNDGWVLACSLCNNARSCADYESYVEAVELARLLALHEESGFRRPTTIVAEDGSWSISLETARERKKAARLRRDERRAARVETAETYPAEWGTIRSWSPPRTCRSHAIVCVWRTPGFNASGWRDVVKRTEGNVASRPRGSCLPRPCAHRAARLWKSDVGSAAYATRARLTSTFDQHV